MPASKLSLLGTVFNVGLNVASGYMDYSDARDRGASVPGALAEGALGFILPELMGIVPYIGYQVASGVGSFAVGTYQNAQVQMRQLDRDARNQMPFRNYTFVDGPQIATMRQAGLALARRSKYELQQTVMGNEARYLHR